MPYHKELANAIRALAIDAIEQSKSGHPGAPLGMADMATVLWHDVLVHNPKNPHWINRDRFVLSNGHASMLIYALLYLSGYDLTIDDIKNFRQFGSKTPGHPEFGLTPGVETTTGPLGQGLATAVGMALAEKLLAKEFNRPGFDLFNHNTYVFLGDGCLMEGISHEAASLAGTWGLNKLIALWDDNGISIEGNVKDWFTDNTPERFRAYGWNVIENVDGHDSTDIRKAISQATKNTNKPTLICCKTTIGYGSPNKAGTAATHGSPLGKDEALATKKQLGIEYPPFEIPAKILEKWNAAEKGATAEHDWNARFKAYTQEFPELAKELTRRLKAQLPDDFSNMMQNLIEQNAKSSDKPATRVASLNVLNAIAPKLPELLGGSADLSGSVGTCWKGSVTIKPETMSGNYLAYGVREFAMGAIMNGLALYGGFIPYAGTFLIFSDYAKNAIRLSALMKQRVIWVLTHDSIGVGEDGPTHQPIEQVASLRLIPNMQVWRPCDAVETVVAWKKSLERLNGPSCLALTRQGLEPMPRNSEQTKNIEKGAYILLDCSDPELIIIASGSEVNLAVQAAQNLNAEGRKVRVVSMPCAELFEAQPQNYKESVLPLKTRKRLAIEAASADWWTKYTGLDGKVIGMHSFGESAPADKLFKHFGFTVENVLKEAKALLNK
ncbi:transketolase [Desulfovibrio litoralis DSM 11393]|uniref:Transketolase n=2 Tax=Desulfovibrio litoralis TaxID=466107 RepID=A0A1M7TA61_9BACT|nr:transketolase [Desulfovibrio litoralis DSM 11393]